MGREVVIEELRGTGRVVSHGKVLIPNARYRVTVRQRMVDAPTLQNPSGEVAGVRVIEGSLLSPDVPMDQVGEAVDLELLEDGRRWACLVQSTSGKLVNRDGIK